MEIHICSAWNTSKVVFDLILDPFHLYIPVTSADTTLIHTSLLSPEWSCTSFISVSVSGKSVLLSRANLGSQFISRENDLFCCWFWKRHHPHRPISSKQNILCFSFSLFSLFSPPSCQISIAWCLEKATLVIWKIGCLLGITITVLNVSREKKKKKIKTMVTGLKKLMPPWKDKRSQCWDKKKAAQI